MNKILAVYNKKTGDLLFTQNGVQEEYVCLIALVSDNNVYTSKCILVDRQATTEEKEFIKRELEAKEQEISELTYKILDLKAGSRTCAKKYIL